MNSNSSFERPTAGASRRKRSKMFWKQRSLSLPHPLPNPPTRSSSRGLRYPAFVGITPAYIAMKLAHPIFSVSGISAPGGEQEGGGWRLQDGVPPPSLITFSRPSRASRSREGYPLCLSATLCLLGRTRDSPPLPCPLFLALRATR